MILNGKNILFEYLSLGCFDRECYLIGFMILDDGSFFHTKYKIRKNLDTLFSFADFKNLDEENYEKHLIWSSNVLANKLQKLIDLYQEQINKFPEFISNNLVLDGDEDLVRIKDKLIFGCSIFNQVPYVIDYNKYENLSSDQQSNEKALALLTLFYAEIKDILSKELNHFNGFSLFCKKCMNNFPIPLDEQVLSVTYNFRDIFYLCSKCGTWEHKTIPLFKLPGFSDKRNENRELDNIEDEETGKRCPKCNEYMIHYEKYNPLAFNKLICPECNKLLEDEGPCIFN